MSNGSHFRPLLLGHRGCRLPGFQENSVEAFQHSLDSGCDGFEFDVRLTADQRAICIHDEAVSGKLVSSCTYDQLTTCHFKSPGCRPESPLCCIEDILKIFSSASFLDIELKSEGLELHVLKLLKATAPLHGYFISSFLPEIICRLDELAPEVLGGPADIGYIFDAVGGLRTWRNLPGAWVVPRHDLVTQDLVRAVHAGGRKLATWTVNSPLEMARLAEWDVDAIISDDPVLLSRTVRAL